MIEAISCPSCSTRYGLRPARVHKGLRRARCLRCQGLFDITEAVVRLLPMEEMPLDVPVADPVQAGTVPLIQEQLAPFHEDAHRLTAPIYEDMPSLTTPLPPPPPDVQVIITGPTPKVEALEEVASIEPSSPFAVFDDLDLSLLATEAKPAPEVPLSMSDLGSEEDLFDKAAPGGDGIGSASAAASEVEEETQAGASGFRSAKDAIAKLLGDAPAARAYEPRSTTADDMDMEATLSALEHTLGGTFTGTPKEPENPEAPKNPPLASTVRLTPAELQAAMVAPPSAPESPLSVPAAQTADLNLLKVQMDHETRENVSLEQMLQWVEQGHVQEYHMVARQFSENWIEAGRVPSLRPAFERAQAGFTPPRELPPPPPMPAPARKGLFGWLSGRG